MVQLDTVCFNIIAMDDKDISIQNVIPDIIVICIVLSI